MQILFINLQSLLINLNLLWHDIKQKNSIFITFLKFLKTSGYKEQSKECVEFTIHFY